jgi:PAS domain S-box-containing protein
MPALQYIASAFSASASPTLILHPDAPLFRIAYANDALLNLVGVRLADIVGMPLMQAFPQDCEGDDSAEKRKESFRHALEYVLVLKKAYKEPLKRYDLEKQATGVYERRFWNAVTYPIFDDQGEVEFIVHMPTDVTEFIPQDDEDPKLDEEILRNKNFHHPLFNDYPDAVATIDLYGNFLSVNNVVCELLELDRKTLLNMSFVPFVAPENFQEVFQLFQKGVKGEIQNFDAKVISAKGRQRTLNITNLPMIDNKEVIGIYLVGKDITEMLEAKMEVDRNNQRISTILESITDAFIAVDRNWIITYFNREAEMHVNVQRADVIGKNIWEVFPTARNERFYPEYHRALSEQISVRFNEYIQSKDIWVEVTAYPTSEGLSVFIKDITEKVKSDSELQQAKEKYQSLFDFSPLAKWVYDTRTLKFLAANETAVREYGYSVQEFLSMTVKDIWVPEDLHLLDYQLHTRISERQVTKFQTRHVKKSGQVIYVQVQGQQLPSWGPDVRIVYALNITKQIQAEQALKASEERFKALVQEGSEFIAIADSEERFIYVSPTYKRLGLDPEEMLGKYMFETLHEADRKRVREVFRTLKPDESVRIPPFRRIDYNQVVHWFETIITDLRHDPAVNGVVLNSRDVTERIQMEKKIRESLDHYNSKDGATLDAVYDWDLIENELRWSKGLKEVFGHEQSADLLKESWFDLVHPEDRERVAAAIAESLQARETKWKIEYRFRAADRNYRFVLDRGFFIYDNDGVPQRMIGALRDVSQRVNYTCSIDGLNTRLGEISWMQSHVVRAPLARIMGLSELLRYNEGEITQKELLSLLTDSANELDEIIRNILQQTKSI